MKRTLALALCLSIVAFSASLALAKGGDAASVGRDYSGYNIAVDNDQGVVLNSTGMAGMSKAAGDTFWIYGGPGSVLGKFQTVLQEPGGTPQVQGWIGVDLTEQVPSWRATQTNGGGGGNYVAAAHNDPAVGGASPDYTGYGNSWNHWLILEIDPTAFGVDPSTQTTTTNLSFGFRHDTEPLYDYFRVDWRDQVGGWTELLAQDGSSYDATTMTYNEVAFNQTVAYAPENYYNGNDIVFRLRVTADGAWSDQDGLFSTSGRGAAAVDNVVVTLGGTTVASSADFEDLGGGCADCDLGDFTGHDVGASAGTAGWTPTPSTFVGEFQKVYGNMSDIDPCRTNNTGQMTFIDDGTPPSNDTEGLYNWAGTTGGTYGVPGFFVLNFTGGLTAGQDDLENETWSPEITYDLPGTEDDVANGGAFIRYSTPNHLPLLNGMFRVWHVRSHTVADGWSPWEDNNFVYYSNAAVISNFQVDVTDKMQQSPDLVQMAFGVTDLANLFAFPGNAATPGPTFDNLGFAKYVIGGPVFTTRTIDILSDGFPNNGTLTGSIRVDMNRDIAGDDAPNIPGDSMIVDIVPVIPGSSLVPPVGGFGGEMVWQARINPAFPRALPAGASIIGTDAEKGWQVVAGRVPGQQATTNGVWVEDRYYFDLPDGPAHVNAPHQTPEPGFFYPGDVIQYYIEATDNGARTTTLPANIDGFGDFDDTTDYSRLWTIRGLPTRDPALGEGAGQPKLLLYNDFGHRGGEQEQLMAMQQNGYREGIHYDTYTTKGPSSGVSNGIGSAGSHGATPAQLAGYCSIITLEGNLGGFLISDGTNANSNDKGDDISTLQGWHEADADRYHVYFGDDFAEGMGDPANGPLSGAYLNNTLGVDLVAADVSPAIGGQTSPIVTPSAAIVASFATDYVAFGGCLVINDFDEIQPLNGTTAIVGHEYRSAVPPFTGTGIAASVLWDRLEAGRRKVTLTFGHGLLFIRNPQGTGQPKSTRALVMGEILNYIGCVGGGGPAIGTPEADNSRFVVFQNAPNPFNPSTKIKYVAARKGMLDVQIFNVRGELVTDLSREVQAGEGTVVWNGRDGAGAEVSSGVYLYQLKMDNEIHRGKMALVK